MPVTGAHEELTAQCKQVLTIRLRGYLLQGLGYRAAAVPRMVELETAVLSTLLAGSPGSWLRRYVRDQGIAQKAEAVFWGWVATESTQGWLQLTGGRPQRGVGADLREWRVQAAETGGWERMMRKGDSAWFATFRMRVLAALMEGEEGPVYQVTQQRAQQVWANAAKAATRGLAGGKQNREVYNLALIQLEQQREVTLTGVLRRLMTKKSMAKCSTAAIRAGALPRVLKRSRVVDADCTQPVRDVIIDLCAGRQSMKRPAKQMGYRYIAVELKAVIRAVRGNQRADVVMDLTEVPPAQLLAAIAELAGVLIQEIKFVWASVPCETLSRLDPSNQRHTHHREYSKDSSVVCKQRVVVVTGGTREPVTELGEDHDIMIASVLQALDAAFNLYGIHWAVENPNAQLGRRPVLLSLMRSGRVKCGRVNYCQYDHIFAKDTCVRTTVLQWTPKGRSGTGMCRKETGNCSAKTGFFNQQTRRWNHHNTIGGKAARSVKGPSKDEVQNRVPLKLLLEILQALPK
jgi:hypothetical protein